MVNIWKITPGEGAFLWEDCKKQKCIAIGWNETDFTKYNSLEDVKRDFDRNNANSIWNFYKEIKIGDIVIANEGIKNVLGIGVIKSDYIEPKDPENPQIDYKHVRKVDWLITEKLENLSNKFDLKTVTLQNDFKKWEEIKKEYINKNPEYSNIFDKLIQNNDLSGLIKSFLKEINTQELQRHRNEHNTRSKNVQEKLKEEEIGTLTEAEMLSLLKDTDAAYGVRFNLKDIFSKNDGFEEFKT
jgi:hypothetical protein